MLNINRKKILLLIITVNQKAMISTKVNIWKDKFN